MKYIVTAIICLIIGYIIGVLLPFTSWALNLDNNPITIAEYIGLWINGFVAIGTGGAVIVALFKEELRSLFKKVDMSVTLTNEDIEEDVEDIKGTKKAKRYHNSLSINNIGNITAEDCELYLEKAILTTDTQTKFLMTETTPVSWDSNKNSIYIPPQSRRLLQLFEMLPPQKVSKPNSPSENTPARISVLGLPLMPAEKGELELTYSINTKNAGTKKFVVTISWHGEWEHRKTEMKNYLTINIR